MFEFKDKDFYKKLLSGEVSSEQLKDHLIRNHSAYELADALCDYLIEELEFSKNKIVLTNKQTQLLEILLGKIARPVNEGLGRKPKTVKYLEARENINPDLFIKK